MGTTEIVASIKHLIRTVTHYDVIRFDPSFHAGARHARLLRSKAINLIFDVGANAGQYAQEVRREGYGGNIVSFEPLPEAFSTLARLSARDPKNAQTKLIEDLQQQLQGDNLKEEEMVMPGKGFDDGIIERGVETV